MSDDYTLCPDCEQETLGPDDHKCPNPECPSHVTARRASRAALAIPYDAEELGRRVAWHGRPVPQSRAEWQYAADLAELALMLESARMYGLVEGGPEVNTTKCEWMIDAASRYGITPAPSQELLDAFVRELSGAPA